MSKNSIARAITATVLCWSLWYALVHCQPIVFSTLVGIMLCIMIAELKNMVRNTWRFFILLPFYPIIPCLILIYFNQTPTYKILLYALLIIVFTFDSASYVTGKICSKLWQTTKIIPAISPGKSWEGACGGYLITTSLLLIHTLMQGKNLYWQTLLLSACICTIAFAGDIFESYLKRSANIKDSGTLLPGHGGFLDRFDAILAVSYFFFLLKDYLLICLK